MKNKKLLKKIDYIEYLTIGLSIGLILAYSFNLGLINGFSIGISLGFLLQRIIQEKKILLSIYILVGLIIGCLVTFIFDLSISVSIFFLSFGMLLGTIVYLLVPNNSKKGKIKMTTHLMWSIIFGMFLGGLLGFITYRVKGMPIGIGLGMILAIIFNLKISRKTK